MGYQALVVGYIYTKWDQTNISYKEQVVIISLLALIFLKGPWFLSDNDRRR